ncbi:MAG: LysM peptidoglycan-binding domain-containing protein [Clostridiales bacterium]|jgi:LysM repeat protein|nr:LysM peptidoglycan-binding domain-containing protein [Clostridiales bacterium]
MKRESHTDFNLNLDMEMELEKTNKVKRDRQAAETYYTDNISRNAVGRLFDDYVRDEERMPEVNVVTGYNDEAAEVPPANFLAGDVGDFFEEYTEIAKARKAEPAYMDYITSMSRSNQTERLKGLTQPESIKQYTVRQEIIRERNPAGSERYRSRTKKVEPIDDYADEEYGDVYETDRNRLGGGGGNKVIPAVGGFIIIAVFAFFVFKINAVNAELKLAQNELKENADILAEHQTLRIENDDLKRQIQELEANMQNMTAANPGATQPDPVGEAEPTPDEPTTPQSPAETPPAASAAPAAGTTYTVKSGDTLWSIAVSAYGDGNKSAEIMS